MDSDFVGTWKRSLEIQGSRRSTEHVPPSVEVADQQKQIILKMAGKMPGKKMKEKEKQMKEIITIQTEDAVGLAKAILMSFI
jgi:hypothetical protein